MFQKKQQSKWMILGGVILAILLSSLDQTIVSTAMPTIVQELQGLEHISWVFTAYMLGSTVTVPIYGKLSDIFGRRKLYLVGILVFLGGSMLCGLSQNMEQLILFRALQGIGGGAMMVNSFAIIGDVFPPAERGRYQGLIGGVFGLSSVAGPLLGGWITDHTSWRWVFYVNIPLGIIAIAVLSAALPRSLRIILDKKIDWLGAAFIAATLVPLLLSLVWGGSEYSWLSLPILGSMAFALASLFIFIRIEKKAQDPILSLKLFQNRVFVVSVSALFITAIGMFGAILYVPLYSQGVLGGTATEAGLVLTPMMLSLVTASAISGQIISRTGQYKALAVGGTAVIVFALFYFSTITATTTRAELMVHMIILGLGLGSTMPIYTLAVQSAFGSERLGEVTAASQLFRSVGGTVGTAILGGIMNSRLSAQMSSLGQEAFVRDMSRIDPSGNYTEGSFIQSVLNPQKQQQIRSMVEQLPPSSRGTVMQDMDRFILLAKDAFSNAIDSVFFVAGCLMMVGLIVVLFLPQVPLRKADKPASKEWGEELEEEFGQSDKDHQPRILAARNERKS